MNCLSPIKAWRSHTANDSGKRGLSFNPKDSYRDLPVKIACGQCINCRIEHSRAWALRCVNEAQLHQDNCFITLTLNDENLPANASLDVELFQKFMKRLRKKIYPQKVRFFHCGEYGSCDPDNPKHIEQYGISKLGRPHYHALLFGFDVSDKILISERDGIKLYSSPMLEKIWGLGFVTVGEVTFESAAYCARYIQKKINGSLKDDHYKRTFTKTGEIVDVKPEYTTMSRRPGIGAKWLEKYKTDMYPKGFTTIKGKKILPPRFYKELLEKIDPALAKKSQVSRINNTADTQTNDDTLERVKARFEVRKQQIKKLIRPLDDEENLNVS